MSSLEHLAAPRHTRTALAAGAFGGVVAVALALWEHRAWGTGLAALSAGVLAVALHRLGREGPDPARRPE